MLFFFSEPTLFAKNGEKRRQNYYCYDRKDNSKVLMADGIISLENSLNTRTSRMVFIIIITLTYSSYSKCGSKQMIFSEPFDQVKFRVKWRFIYDKSSLRWFIVLTNEKYSDVQGNKRSFQLFTLYCYCGIIYRNSIWLGIYCQKIYQIWHKNSSNQRNYPPLSTLVSIVGKAKTNTWPKFNSPPI